MDTPINQFDMMGHTWLHDPMVVMGSFLYASAMDPACDPCTATCPVSLFRMAIDPLTGDLGAPTLVTAIDDGGGNVATGVNSRLTTDGSCIYASDVGDDSFCEGDSTSSSGSSLIFRICGTTVKVWADTQASGGPGLNGSAHTISFGPNNANLFLIEFDGTVYSTTGLSGSTPGSFSQIGTLLNTGAHSEGSAFLSMGGLNMLYVGNESDEDLDAVRILGSGGSVALGADTDVSGEEGAESGNTGDQVEFDEAEGLAIVNGSPRLSTGVAFFSTGAKPVPVMSLGALIGSGMLLLVIGAASLVRRRQLD